MGRSVPKLNFAASIANIDGLKEWEAANNKRVSEKVARAVTAHAGRVADEARSLVPVKSGLLQSTIQVKASKNPLATIVKTDHGKAPHDFLVHFGTKNMEGRPFLYQANENLADALPQEIKSELESA